MKLKQILIISGKGGTGKTIITAAFAALSNNACFADCDVDAADLHLLLSPKIRKKEKFQSGRTARIDKHKCKACGKCFDVCRFGAVKQVDGNFFIDEISCEGCDVCSYICPFEAIKMEDNDSGEWYVSDSKFGPLVHAKLGIAEENSGKLVTLVRNKAKELAEKEKLDYIIIDGPPGIGCPVIASLANIDCAIVVTEPTLSGMHDAERVIKVAKHFGVLVKLIINKYDLNQDMTDRICEYARENSIEIMGKISFNKEIVNAMVQGKTIFEFDNQQAKQEVSSIWEKLNIEGK